MIDAPPDPLDGVDWRDDAIPVSRRFDDPYFSLQGGLAETGHVFLAGNDLPARWAARDVFHIAELGFGTGLNFLATLQAFRATPRAGRLLYTSFEAFPLGSADLRRALAGFPGLPVASLIGPDGCAPGAITEGPDFTLRLQFGDVAETLPRWEGRADAWYLDGFAPAKNPGMWSDTIMAGVAAHTAQGGTFATYTAAGHVRRALAAAGFAVERVPGYGRKRHMTRGRLTGDL